MKVPFLLVILLNSLSVIGQIVENEMSIYQEMQPFGTKWKLGMAEFEEDSSSLDSLIASLNKFDTDQKLLFLITGSEPSTRSSYLTIDRIERLYQKVTASNPTNKDKFIIIFRLNIYNQPHEVVLEEWNYMRTIYFKEVNSEITKNLFNYIDTLGVNTYNSIPFDIYTKTQMN